nr:uncharacterized protein LOC113809737 isoform X2 [Penaeus vannamei]
MARQWLWMCVWVVALVVSGSAHSRRQNDNKKGPEAVLVETLRQVLGVPKSEGGPGFHHKTHRPPRYMVHLYQRITDGHSTLPRSGQQPSGATRPSQMTEAKEVCLFTTCLHPPANT